jgi:hypothetical protein
MVSKGKIGSYGFLRMRQKLVILLEHFNWVILVALLALSIGLGLANNLRVDDEKRVNWLGGSVSSSDDFEDPEADT